MERSWEKVEEHAGAEGCSRHALHTAAAQHGSSPVTDINGHAHG